MNATHTTIAARFASYANQAHDRVMNDVGDEGTNAELFDWLRDDPDRHVALVEILDLFAHRMILARRDVERYEAQDHMTRSLAPLVDRFIASWDDERRVDLMAEVDEETRVARELDHEEGIY